MALGTNMAEKYDENHTWEMPESTEKETAN